MDSLRDLSQGPRKGPNTQVLTVPGASFDQLILIALTSLLAACGSSSDSLSGISSGNHAPQIDTNNIVQTPEQVRSVGVFSATDSDGDQLLWSIEGGADAELFSISASGELKFIVAPDYEQPNDTNIDNIYQVSISASDRRATVSELLSIEIMDRLEGRVGGDPVIGARVFLDLNANAQLDLNEPQAITSDSGHFIFTEALPTDNSATQIISLGGANKNTDISIAHLGLVSELPQQSGMATMVTPLTTVLSQISYAPERDAFLQMMGLSQDATQIYTLDAWAKSLAGDPGSQDTQRLNQQILLLIMSLDSLLDTQEPLDPLIFSEVFTQQLIANLVRGRASLTQTAAIKSMLYQSHNRLRLEQDFSSPIDPQIIEVIARALAAVSEIFASPKLNPVSDFSIALRRAAFIELRRLIRPLINGQISPQSFVQQSSIEILFANIQVEGFPDSDGDGLVDILDADSDNDGVLNSFDAFPTVFAESLDTDTDGIGNNADTDTDGDGDGVPDAQDAFPLNASESLDTDGDGLGNKRDTDDDGDGVEDLADHFPLNGDETIDTDNDGIGNNADSDDDGDAVPDSSDAFPLDASEAIDTDQDGIGNNADSDDDGDQIADTDDRFPLDASEFIDSDTDGLGNNSDPDDDNDGIADAFDPFPLDPSETLDTDQDGIGNNADPDDDGDGIADTLDAFPLDTTESIDSDGDGLGNNADTDDDGDNVADSADAFPLDANESIDSDGDGIGNNADTDDDGDGVADTLDAFPLDATETIDTNGDGVGNNVDPDDDGDGVADSADAYPLDASRSAEDTFDKDSWANTVWGAESDQEVSIWNADLWGAKEWK
jgi:hypothetical protein